jgi:hypothetical protein
VQILSGLGFPQVSKFLKDVVGIVVGPFHMLESGSCARGLNPAENSMAAPLGWRTRRRPSDIWEPCVATDAVAVSFGRAEVGLCSLILVR